MSMSGNTARIPELSKALKRNFASPHPSPPPSPPPGGPRKKRRKTVRFRSPTPPPLCQALRPEPGLPNLCAHSNLCNQLSQLLNHSSTRPDRCIGVIGDPLNSKHLIYLDSRAQCLTQGFAPTTSSSLKSVLQSLRQTNLPNHSIPQLDRIRLAKQLAMAVLSFHATPWLKSTWCSEDVFFHGIGSQISQHTPGLNDPYVDVAIQSPLCSGTSVLGTVISELCSKPVPLWSRCHAPRNCF